MKKLPFKFNYEKRYCIRKATSSMKNRTAHRRQSTDTSKEILDNSLPNNITTTNPKLFSVQNSRFFMRIIKSIEVSPVVTTIFFNDNLPSFRHSGKQKGEREKGEREREEEIGKERANKTTRVKWGRGKREANGK